MKKLLLIGSDSIHIYNFIELIKNYFDEVLLLTDDEHREYSIQTIAIDFGINRNSFKTIKKIKSVVNDFQPTVVHIHQANSYALLTLLAIRKYRVKKILNAWGSDILINPKKHFLLKQIVKYNLKQADIVVADSDTVLNEAKKLVSHIKTKNINFGIDFLSCKDEKENIIYSNRLHKDLYNIDKIIFSFSRFVQENRDWILVIAGNGEDTQKLKEQVSQLKIEENVKFIGFVDRKTNFEYYCKAKIYVSIPRSDSVSLSLVEAIVSGCVVFVSDLSANHEIVDNTLGFVVDSLEHIPFHKYNTIDRLEQGEKRSKLKHLFSKDYNKQRYIDIYEN